MQTENNRTIQKPFTELAKGRSQDTRQIVISKINSVGTYKLAELAEFREGDKTRKMFLRGGIEVQNLEYLESIMNAIKEVLSVEGWYDEEQYEEDADEYDHLAESDRLVAEEAEIKHEDHVISEVLNNVVETMSDDLDEKEIPDGVEELLREKGLEGTLKELSEPEKTFEEKFDEYVIKGERIPDDMLNEAFTRKIIDRDMLLQLKIFGKAKTEQVPIAEAAQNVIPPASHKVMHEDEESEEEWPEPEDYGWENV